MRTLTTDDIKINELVCVHVMGYTPPFSLQSSKVFSCDWETIPELNDRIEALGLIDAHCRALDCCRNRIFAGEPMPRCNPSRVAEWVLISATPMQRSLAALRAVGYDTNPLLDDMEWPELPEEDK